MVSSMLSARLFFLSEIRKLLQTVNLSFLWLVQVWILAFEASKAISHAADDTSVPKGIPTPPKQGSVLSFPLLANRKFTFLNLILKKWLWEILRDYDSDMSHRWGFIPEILGFKLHMFTCVCFFFCVPPGQRKRGTQLSKITAGTENNLGSARPLHTHIRTRSSWRKCCVQ